MLHGLAVGATEYIGNIDSESAGIAEVAKIVECGRTKGIVGIIEDNPEAAIGLGVIHCTHLHATQHANQAGLVSVFIVTRRTAKSRPRDDHQDTEDNHGDNQFY